MSRRQILWLQGWIALCGSVFWLLEPRLPHWKPVLIISLLWAGLCILSIWADSLEDWAHRISSFVGFSLCTVEGILGLLGFAGKPGLLLIALLHGFTFLLAMAGKYQSRSRRRPKRSIEDLTQQALRESQMIASSGPDNNAEDRPSSAEGGPIS